MRQKGFGVVEIIVIILLVAAIIFGGWWIWSNQNKAGSNTNTTPVTTDPAVPVDETESWITYCATDDSVCFKHPSEWTAAEQDSYLPGQYKSLIITSPDKAITLNYTPEVDGLGGYCDPGACLLETLSISSLSDPALANVKLVKAVQFNNSDYRAPIMFLMSEDKINSYKLKVGEQIDVGFFVQTFVNPDYPKKDSWFYIRFSDHDISFTEQTALDWFSTQDAITSEKILSTIYKK